MRTILIAVAGLFAMAAEPLLAQPVDLHVEIDESGPTLEFLDSASVGCSTSVTAPGDVCVGAEKSPFLTWGLDDESHDDGWKLTRIKFFADNSYTTDSTALAQCTLDAFGQTGCTTSGCDASEALVVANGKRIKLYDCNSAQCTGLVACTTYYELCAQKDGKSASEICAHPVIDNKGTDRNLLPGSKLDRIIEILEEHIRAADSG